MEGSIVGGVTSFTPGVSDKIEISDGSRKNKKDMNESHVGAAMSDLTNRR